MPLTEIERGQVTSYAVVESHGPWDIVSGVSDILSATCGMANAAASTQERKCLCDILGACARLLDSERHTLLKAAEAEAYGDDE